MACFCTAPLQIDHATVISQALVAQSRPTATLDQICIMSTLLKTCLDELTANIWAPLVGRARVAVFVVTEDGKMMRFESWCRILGYGRYHPPLAQTGGLVRIAISHSTIHEPYRTPRRYIACDCRVNTTNIHEGIRSY